MRIERDAYKEVADFVSRGHANDGNYNFTAGVLEAVLCSALSELPKAKREVLLDRLIDIDIKYFTNKSNTTSSSYYQARVKDMNGVQ